MLFDLEGSFYIYFLHDFFIYGVGCYLILKLFLKMSYALGGELGFDCLCIVDLRTVWRCGLHGVEILVIDGVVCLYWHKALSGYMIRPELGNSLLV